MVPVSMVWCLVYSIRSVLECKYIHARMYVCTYTCVYVYVLFVYMYVCLYLCNVVNGLAFALWWRPERAGGSSVCLTSQKGVRLVCAFIPYTKRCLCSWTLASGPRSQPRIPVIAPFWGSPAQPKFKAGKMVTEHPLAGSRGISIEGLGILDCQFKV